MSDSSNSSTHSSDLHSSPSRILSSDDHETMLTPIPGNLDAEGITLLRQIFPDQPDEELERLHKNRIQHSTQKEQRLVQPSPTSKLGQRISKQSMWLEESLQEQQKEQIHGPLHWQVALPDDFLRLPPDVALRHHNEQTGRWEYQLVKELESRVLEQFVHYQERLGRMIESPVGGNHYTRVVSRDNQHSLGMTLCEQDGCIWVHSLIGRDGSRWFMAPPDEESGGPALQAGIRPGDWLLGIHGQALMPTQNGSLLRRAVLMIQYAADPVVLHLRRMPSHEFHPMVERNGITPPDNPLNSPSLLDTTAETLDTSAILDYESPDQARNSSTPYIHTFVSALAAKGLIASIEDRVAATKSLAQYTERARQWESTSSFRLDIDTSALRPHFDPNDLPPWMTADNLSFLYADAKSIRPYTPSTPTLDPRIDNVPFQCINLSDGAAIETNDVEHLFEQQGLLGFEPKDFPHRKAQPERSFKSAYPGKLLNNRDQQRQVLPALQHSDIFIPLMGVRKALCVRILNTFLEENRTAYTIWVYDVESGREWYAPIRYFRDFIDLRSATLPVCPSIAQIPFPATGWGVFGSSEKSESESVRDGKCRLLEGFLRTLCTLVYTDPLHPDIAEIAIHVQSFLGCDISIGQPEDIDLRFRNQVAMNETMWGQKVEEGHSTLQMSVRLLLKRSIQRYTYRLFLLDTMKGIIDDFVASVRINGPRLNDIEALEAQGRNVLKERALADLEKIQAFLDQIQDLIVGGCMDDFHSIAQRRDYFALKCFFEGDKGKTYFDRIVREAVREQIEIEIYVPLRSVVSRLLVNGWRHDDMEMHFKMQELRKRPQTMFRIPAEKQSPSGWRSVSSILSEGVGMSTLPCAKLRAIVDSAKEIIRVYAEEHGGQSHNIQDLSFTEMAIQAETEDGPQNAPLGADDFLPMFIYCVVRAEMERPCALSVLLRTLCDRTNRIGETGYYLATFEAAIAHIQEIDLTEDRDETLSRPPTINRQ